jgi:transposase
MDNLQQRHDISDKIWEILSPLLPGQKGQWGGVAENNRRFLNGVFEVMTAMKS